MDRNKETENKYKKLEDPKLKNDCQRITRELRKKWEEDNRALVEERRQKRKMEPVAAQKRLYKSLDEVLPVLDASLVAEFNLIAFLKRIEPPTLAADEAKKRKKKEKKSSSSVVPSDAASSAAAPAAEGGEEEEEEEDDENGDPQQQQQTMMTGATTGILLSQDQFDESDFS